jgi:flavin reductase (DIM6/NTAB) family NADH-FMN oxidoreductase RutF
MDDAQTQAKRTVLRMFHYGLYVITARDDAGVAGGFTANWVTQTGFEPPMVAVGIAVDARTLQLIRATGLFAVNVIEDGNRDLLRRLGRPAFKAPDKLEGLDLRAAAHGTPVLATALGYVECALRGELQYGADHQLIVGEIVDAGAFRDGPVQTMAAAGMKYSG